VELLINYFKKIEEMLMKNLIVVTTILILALLLGCQDNHVNQPESSPLLKGKKPIQEKIEICCEVDDTNYGMCSLNGFVYYTHEVIQDAMHPRAENLVSLKLYMNSALCDKLGMMHLDWRIEDKSENVFYVSEEGIYLLEKSYWITNRDDVVLLVHYLVTTDGVGISKITLAPMEK
jgi:hypothetical protein